MDKKQIKDAYFRTALEGLQHAAYIENDIILTEDIRNSPVHAEPRKMNFILVALCLRGTASYTVDTQQRTVCANDAILVSDGHVLDDYSVSADFKGIYMIMSVNFYHEVVKNVNDISSMFLFTMSHPVVRLSEGETALFSSYFGMLREKAADKASHYRRDVVRSLVMAMFYELGNVIYRMQQTSYKRQTRADAIFTSFIMLVEDNYKLERRVGWYAEKLCITPKYLSETVKQVSKRTPNEWIDSYVTLEIRVLLKNSTKSIKEIAMEMNFPNQSFLGKYFKEHVGMSPSSYRRS